MSDLNPEQPGPERGPAEPPRRGPYELPEALREEIFLQGIVPKVLLAGEPQPHENPEVVLLGGQPGAGKSTTAGLFRREFAERGGVAWVTWDDFRPFHPAYEQLLRERPEEMPDATRPTARWWQDRAAEYLRARHYNVVLEGGFREPASVMQTAEQFADAGYTVRVAALAVPAVLSRLGVIERYAAQLDQVGTGRWTTTASHDADYAGTPEVLGQAQDSPAVHRITLLTRDGVVYDRPTGRSPATQTPVEVLHEARNEPLSRLQRTALANRLADTMDQVRRHGAGHDNLYEMAAAVSDDLIARTALAGQGPAAGRSVSAQLDAAWADIQAATQALDAQAPPHIEAEPPAPGPPPPEPDLGPDL